MSRIGWAAWMQQLFTLKIKLAIDFSVDSLVYTMKPSKVPSPMSDVMLRVTTIHVYFNNFLLFSQLIASYLVGAFPLAATCAVRSSFI